MAGKVACITIHVSLTTILLVAAFVISGDTTPVPAEKSQLNTWFNSVVKPYRKRIGTLDPRLATAQKGAKVIRVSKNGGDFRTVSDAIKSIPAGNTKRVIVYIGAGVYSEKIKIERSKLFVTLYGSMTNRPTLKFSGTAAQYGTVDSATLIVESNYFVAVNINVVNSAPRPDGKRKQGQALALRISGDKAAFYNRKFRGFQDTLCDDRGRHLFKNCYIEGTVDFIFGSGTSLYLGTKLKVLGDVGFSVITAHARDSASENTRFSFVHCSVTGTGNNAFLGRAWRPRPRVVFAYTSMSSVVNPAGWSNNFHPERDSTVFNGEYKCSGPGSNPSRRVQFAKQLSDAEARPFLTLNFIRANSWLLPPPRLKMHR